MPPDPLREVLIEIVRMGESMKVTAIDPETATEAVVIGPSSAPSADLQTLAIKKLERALGLRAPPPAPPRPGKLV